MATDNDYNQLLSKLDDILRQQNALSGEISKLQHQIREIKQESAEEINAPVTTSDIQQEVKQPETTLSSQESPTTKTTTTTTISTITTINSQDSSGPKSPYSPYSPSDEETNIPSWQLNFEKFIGENLINKIGIAITIIGVAIGTKYSIEHQLISPVMRIILGYLLGIALISLGIRLKKKYENYSAVLVSGAMTILYFITYSAYGFYNLFPQAVAFLLMLVFTVFTVVAALNYNRQVIAHIGLVGAYAVPFLLSENSGRIEILFAYTAILNCGILTIAVKKYWKPLYYSSFIITWLIYLVWFMNQYDPKEHVALALSFVAVFFTIFYAIFLVYKLNRKEKFDAGDIFLLLSNSFIFYGIGYNVMDAQPGWQDYLGLFTLGNAFIHFLVSLTIYRQKLADRNLFYLVGGLALVFITIAIPVQLNGTWVTLLWAFEAALLFSIGIIRHEEAYEKLSYPLMILAVISLLQDWVTTYGNYPVHPDHLMTPFLNVPFLSGCLFLACFGGMYVIASRYKNSWLESSSYLKADIRIMLSSLALVVLYFVIRFELLVYFNNRIALSDRTLPYQQVNLSRFKTIWMINYSMLYVSVMALYNNLRSGNKYLSTACFILGSFMMLIFLTVGLYEMSELRDSFMTRNLLPDSATFMHIGIRYISFLFAAFLLFCMAGIRIQPAFDFVLAISLLWVCSSELIHWLHLLKYPATYKLLLSILWGVFAFVLTGTGIWKQKKHLRISAMVLFSATIIKLFFYDMSHVGTLARTIGFLSLGLLLLLVSFLYNKYKDVIF
jgi:hypothetical protein